MDHKLELEITGERAANYLRLFLIFIFSAGTLAGHLIQNQVSHILGNYIGGIIIYIIATITSVTVLKLKKYTTNVKYYTMGMELVGYSFVMFGFLRLTDPEMLTIAINDIVLYAIYYIIIAESTLRFSPKFTLITGLSCTIIFTILGILIKAKGGDKAVFAVTTLTIILGSLFLFAMTIASYFGTKFVRRMVNKFKVSEEEANRKSEELSKLIKQAQFTVMELDSIVDNINLILDESVSMSNEQLSLSESSIQTVTHFSDSINSIAGMAKKQEESCEANSQYISHLNEVTEKIEFASNNIDDRGKFSLTLAEKGEVELNQSISEIQNIAQSSNDASKIISLINAIANQTNLLALNASIEAARAGEEGRGFEIVASEVSKLAESSVRNAKLITALIVGMKATVEKGESQIKSTSSIMQEIMSTIVKTSCDVKEITMTIKEQVRIIKESKVRTSKIQEMAQKMKELTVEEEKNSSSLKKDISKVFEASKKMSANIKLLHGTAEKLQDLSSKLEQEIKINRVGNE